MGGSPPQPGQTCPCYSWAHTTRFPHPHHQQYDLTVLVNCGCDIIIQVWCAFIFRIQLNLFFLISWIINLSNFYASYQFILLVRQVHAQIGWAGYILREYWLLCMLRCRNAVSFITTVTMSQLTKPFVRYSTFSDCNLTWYCQADKFQGLVCVIFTGRHVLHLC